ncbi:Helix-loop-helix DNA-binding domain protein, partial [Ostertagia ostertagi]
MHDLNEALEELRSCLPYSQDQSARKMSKINTLLLACNWIRQLTIRNHELQKQVAALRAEDRISVPIGPPPPSSHTNQRVYHDTWAYQFRTRTTCMKRSAANSAMYFMS